MSINGVPSFQSPGSIGSGQVPFKNPIQLPGEFNPIPMPRVDPGDIPSGPKNPQDWVTISKGADGSETVGGFQGGGSLRPGTPMPLLPDIQPGSFNFLA